MTCTLKCNLKYKKYMSFRVLISYLFLVCAIITIKMATILIDILFLKTAVTVTSICQRQMINWLCLNNAWSELNDTKAVRIRWLIYFIYELAHWSRLWPRPLISKVKSRICRIFEISDLVVKTKSKRANFMNGHIFCEGYLILVFCSSVQVWRFCRWQQKYRSIIVSVLHI